MSTDSIVGVAQGLDIYSGVYMYNLFQDVVVLILCDTLYVVWRVRRKMTTWDRLMPSTAP